MRDLIIQSLISKVVSDPTLKVKIEKDNSEDCCGYVGFTFGEVIDETESQWLIYKIDTNMNIITSKVYDHKWSNREDL